MFQESLAVVGRTVRIFTAGAVMLGVCGLAGAVITSANSAEAQEASAEPLIAFGAPVPGYHVNSPFGLRRMPWEKRGRLHAGVDIAAPSGSAVLATTGGVITKAGFSATYGKYVEVAHGEGLTSFYAHLDQSADGLKPGVFVAGGEQIGEVGSTGRSTGPHLHFEMRKDGAPMNPQLFMQRKFAKAEDLPFAKSRAHGHDRVAAAHGAGEATWPPRAKS